MGLRPTERVPAVRQTPASRVNPARAQRSARVANAAGSSRCANAASSFGPSVDGSSNSRMRPAVLGLATCFLRAVDDPRGPGQAVMNAPVLGKIGNRRSQRGDGLIRTVVVLKVPTASAIARNDRHVVRGARFPKTSDRVPVPRRRPGQSRAPRGRRHARDGLPASP